MKESILLVDDEKIFNFISTKILQGMGVSDEIHTATNGDSAIELINNYFSGVRSIPRLILIDLNMPVMDGFAFIEAFQRLHIANKDRAVLAVLTSSSNQQDKDRARALGIKYFLTKPISEREIRDVLVEAGILGDKKS
jgi:CheY-like chemotaxis protein